MNIAILKRLVESPEFQTIAPGARVAEGREAVWVEYQDPYGVTSVFEMDNPGFRIDPPDAARWVPDNIRQAHLLVVATPYIDESVTGYSDDMNAEFQAAADRVNQILDASSGEGR